MAASASVTYSWTDDECIHVEVSTEASHADALDELTRRADDLLAHAIATVNAQARAAEEAT